MNWRHIETRNNYKPFEKNIGNEPSTYGKEKRLENRKKEKEKIKNKVILLIESKLKELHKSFDDINEETYKIELEKLLDILRNVYTTTESFSFVNNLVASYVNKGNEDGKWLLEVPDFLFIYKGVKPLRGVSWFKYSRLINKVNSSWEKQLSENIDKNETNSDILASVLISASLNGGLCIPEAIVSLANMLNPKKSKILHNNDNLVWIDIIFKSKNHNNNIKKDKKLLCLHRWYPDAITLSWIYNYYNSKKHNQKYNLKTCWDLIKQKFLKIDKNSAVGIQSFGPYCKASITVLENKTGIELNQVMVNYAIGNISSSSLPHATHNESQEITNIQISAHGFFDKTNFKTKTKNTKKRIVAVGYEKLISDVKKALAEKIEGKKNTPIKARNALNEILQYELSDPAHLLLEWFNYLLGKQLINDINVNKRKTLKVSSVRCYFAAIGVSWLAYTVDVDILGFDEYDFEGLYENILKGAYTENSKKYNAKRIEQFHDFCTEYYDFPYIETFTKSKFSSDNPFVRACFISEYTFTNLRNAISKVTDLDKLSKTGIEVLLIIAYRTGLRRGELVKLTLEDIEKSDDKWLFIRNNKFGNNKTFNGLRKIPLIPLLTKSEAKFVNKYFEDKMQDVEDKLKRPAFSLEQSPTLPINTNALAGLVRKILSDLCTSDHEQYTFHSLRHTALSRLQIILENDKELIQTHTIYSSDEINTIQKLLGGYGEKNKKDIYWNLGKLAGHRSPETLFAHYLHFTDILFANKVNNLKQMISRNSVLNISGVSKNILTKTIKEKITNKPHGIKLLTLGTMKEMIIERLEPFYLKNISKKTIHEDSRSQEGSISNKSTNIMNFKFNISPRNCLNILRKIESNVNLNNLSAQYNISVGKIMRIVKISQNLSGILTSKSRQRFFSTKKKIPRVGFHLAPVNPKSDSEREEANKAFVIYEKNYLTHKNLYISCIEYFKNNKTTTSSGMKFDNFNDLGKYIKFLNMTFYKNRIKLYFTPLKSSKLEPALMPSLKLQKSKWKDICQGVEIIETNLFVKDHIIYPYGKIEVYLLNENSTNIITKRNAGIKKEIDGTPKYKKFSSNLPSYLIYILAVLIEIQESKQLN